MANKTLNRQRAYVYTVLKENNYYSGNKNRNRKLFFNIIACFEDFSRVVRSWFTCGYLYT